MTRISRFASTDAARPAGIPGRRVSASPTGRIPGESDTSERDLDLDRDILTEPIRRDRHGKRNSAPMPPCRTCNSPVVSARRRFSVRGIRRQGHRSCHGPQVLVLEGARHPLDLIRRNSETGRNIAPPCDRPPHLRRNLTGGFVRPYRTLERSETRCRATPLGRTRRSRVHGREASRRSARD